MTLDLDHVTLVRRKTQKKMYTLSQKQDTILLSVSYGQEYSILFLTQSVHFFWIRTVTLPNVNQFQNFLTVGLTGKFVIKSYLNTPPDLKHAATLPCKISMFKKSPCSRSNSSKL